MIQAFRLCKTKHAASAFTGEGARLNGGRWNSPGVAVVYASSSLSLATLEVLVHLEDPEIFSRLFSWIPLEMPEAIIEELAEATLPAGWLDDEANAASRAVGDAWVRGGREAVLAVPSVVTPGEWNYLLNPAHAEFGKVRIGKSSPFRPDPRLLR